MHLSLAVPVLIAFLMLPVAGTKARADDKADCERMLPSVRIAACTRIIEDRTAAQPVRALAYANRGRGYLTRSGEERLAAADFNAARALVPDTSSDGALFDALAAIASDRLPQALSLLNDAIKRNPQSAPAFVTRGSVHIRRGALNAALSDFDQAVRLAPVHAAGYAGRGIVHSQKRQFEAAIADFDAALKHDPTYAGILRRRGLAKTELRRLDEAIADYDSALRLDPQLAVAYNGRGYAYTKKGDFERARIDFEAALRLEPTLLVAHANHGITLMRRGDKTAAIGAFERVLALPALGPEDRRRQQLARERIERLKAALADPAAAQPARRRVALVIGNAKYAHAAVLKNPVNDARAVAASLRRLGFDPVIELIDGTREQMTSALKDFGDKTEGAEWAIAYFAGHGMEINGLSYLVPVDAALRRDTHVEDEAVSLGRVMSKVDAASRIGLVILDACRNNPFAARMTRAAGQKRSLTSGLAPVEPEGNVLVAYAAKHGTFAEDGTGANSPFTEALVAHLEEPGLEINFLFRRVRDDVRRRTERRQEPFVYGSLGNEPLYLRPSAH